jgi:hypothetical protein
MEVNITGRQLAKGEKQHRKYKVGRQEKDITNQWISDSSRQHGQRERPVF